MDLNNYLLTENDENDIDDSRNLESNNARLH